MHAMIFFLLLLHFSIGYASVFAFYLDRCSLKHRATPLVWHSDLTASAAHKTIQELVCRQIKVGMMPHQQR